MPCSTAHATHLSNSFCLSARPMPVRKQTGRNATHRIGIKFLFSALITDELTLLVCVEGVRVATELDATPCRGVRDARLRSAPLTMMRGRCRGHISDMHGPHSPDHPAHVGATGNEGGTEDDDAPSLCIS